APVLVPSTALEVCDDDTDGLAEFDLTPSGSEVTQNQAGYTITYYEDLTQAEDGDSATAIATPAAYTTTVADAQTIYIRVVEEGSTNDCYSIETVDLIVHPLPVIPAITDYVVCDSYLTNDGEAIFDLTTKNAEATSEPTDTVSYYTSEADAQSGTAPIAAADAYQSPTATVWVRVESQYGCVSTAPIELIVNPVPVTNASMAPFQSCEVAPGEGSFMLSDYDATVTDGASGYTVSYYATEADAQGADPAVSLPSPYQSADAIVYALVVDDATGCWTVTPLELEVVPAPVLAAATALEACDDNADGFTAFDLTPAGAEVTQNQPGYTITYYETLADAQDGDNANAIPDPTAYVNVVSPVYIRVVVAGSTTECYTIETVDLIVHPRPVIPAITDYVLCDDNNSPDGVEVFDLTTKDGEATSEPTDTVSYYTSQGEAQAGTQPIANPSAYQSGTATVWVRVESQYGCVSTASFELIVNPLPVINTAMDDFYACEEASGQGEFDLSSLEDEVTNSQAGYNVSFYATPGEAQAGDPTAALPIPYL
ncbi:hypothetical protein ABS766_16695, partial [Flavobacterium sp. ST-119]